MANMGQYLTALLLNWSMTGGAATRPTAWGIALSLGSPTSVSASEVAGGSGYLRTTMAFGAAGTPTSSGTASNASAITFGPFSSAQSISGIVVFDTVTTSSNSGNILWEGLLATARTIGIGDSLVLPTGSLLLTLS